MTEGGTWTPLDHTADIGFEVRGPNAETVLVAAGRALMSLLADPSNIAPRVQRHVSIRGNDPAEVLVRWLSEILYLHDAEGLLLCDFEVERLEGGRLEGWVSGEPFDPTRHLILTEIKAVTYHMAFLGEEGGGWLGRVILDV